MKRNVRMIHLLRPDAIWKMFIFDALFNRFHQPKLLCLVKLPKTLRIDLILLIMLGSPALILKHAISDGCQHWDATNLNIIEQIPFKYSRLAVSNTHTVR